MKYLKMVGALVGLALGLAGCIGSDDPLITELNTDFKSFVVGSDSEADKISERYSLIIRKGDLYEIDGDLFKMAKLSGRFYVSEVKMGRLYAFTFLERSGDNLIVHGVHEPDNITSPALKAAVMAYWNEDDSVYKMTSMSDVVSMGHLLMQYRDKINSKPLEFYEEGSAEFERLRDLILAEQAAEKAKE